MRAAKARTWTTAAAVAIFAVVVTVAIPWPAAAAQWPPADIAGVASDPASPLLAPVDVELKPGPSAPVERAEIILALQPPRSWAGLLDLGISSGEPPRLSETRVWGFFLGSADCIGLERLQVPDSTADASFFAGSLRHGVYFARNNPVVLVDPTGLAAVCVTEAGEDGETRLICGEEIEVTAEEEEGPSFEEVLPRQPPEILFADFSLMDHLLSEIPIDGVDYARCVEDHRFDPVAAVSILGTKIPKRVVPPFRVVKQNQRFTSFASAAAHQLNKLAPTTSNPAARTGFQRAVRGSSKALRGVGRVATPIATPLTIIEGVYDIGVLTACGF